MEFSLYRLHMGNLGAPQEYYENENLSGSQQKESKPRAERAPAHINIQDDRQPDLNFDDLYNAQQNEGTEKQKSYDQFLLDEQFNAKDTGLLESPLKYIKVASLTEAVYHLYTNLEKAKENVKGLKEDGSDEVFFEDEVKNLQDDNVRINQVYAWVMNPANEKAMAEVPGLKGFVETKVRGLITKYQTESISFVDGLRTKSTAASTISNDELLGKNDPTISRYEFRNSFGLSPEDELFYNDDMIKLHKRENGLRKMEALVVRAEANGHVDMNTLTQMNKELAGYDMEPHLAAQEIKQNTKMLNMRISQLERYMSINKRFGEVLGK